MLTIHLLFSLVSGVWCSEWHEVSGATFLHRPMHWMLLRASTGRANRGRMVQIVDMAAPELAPEGWSDHRAPARLAAPTDASIYELHVRDFSVSDATVPAHLRGKYLAFAEADSAGAHFL